MTAAQTTTTSTTNITTLSAAEQDHPPVQRLRVGADGPVISVEAEWDNTLQKYCLRVDAISIHLGVEVDHIVRAEDGVHLNRLRDQNDEM